MKKLIFENAEDFLNSLDLFGPILALDLGTKTIGVAVSDYTRTIATPVSTIKRKKFSFTVDAIIRRKIPFWARPGSGAVKEGETRFCR